MTSSIRNSIHRRNHKERSQLSNRKRLGILEKHKDYVQRARDYHSKQDRIQRLRQKAADRNKDEFYFSMVKERTRQGVHTKDRGNSSLPVDVVKVLKTQDDNYLRTMRMAGQKKIDKLKAQLTSLADLLSPLTEQDAQRDMDEKEIEILRKAGIISSTTKGSNSKTSRHIIFVENNDEAQKYLKVKSSPTDPHQSQRQEQQAVTAGLGWRTPSEKKKGKRKQPPSLDKGNDQMAAALKEEAAQHRKRLLQELSARLARDTQLRYAIRELEMQRLLMGKGARKKLKGVEKVEEIDGRDDEDEDELDARKGRPRKEGRKVLDETSWKPRVYKWKLERKK